jgi:hypothetical protein
MQPVLDPHRRRLLLQRTVGVSVLVGAVVLAGSAEWLRWASHQRVAAAQQAVHRLAVARDGVLLARGDHLRRQLNRTGFSAWAAALATLTANDRPALRGFLEQGDWKVELETTSFESAQRFARALGERAIVRPRRVSDGFGWTVTMDFPEEAWIGWPSQESPSGS